MPSPSELEQERQHDTPPLQDVNYVDIGVIMQYEEGELSEQDTLDMFQKLINSGLAWKLQGHYGRIATALIQNGSVTSPNA